MYIAALGPVGRWTTFHPSAVGPGGIPCGQTDQGLLGATPGGGWPLAQLPPASWERFTAVPADLGDRGLACCRATLSWGCSVGNWPTWECGRWGGWMGLGRVQGV